MVLGKGVARHEGKEVDRRQPGAAGPWCAEYFLIMESHWGLSQVMR